jgi:hypothetical protein
VDKEFLVIDKSSFLDFEREFNCIFQTLYENSRENLNFFFRCWKNKNEKKEAH